MKKRYDRDEEPYYTQEEVIGSAMSYHRTTCHIIQFIERRNYKRLQNWQEALALNLRPCSLCRPCSSPGSAHPDVKRRIGF